MKVAVYLKWRKLLYNLSLNNCNLKELIWRKNLKRVCRYYSVAFWITINLFQSIILCTESVKMSSSNLHSKEFNPIFEFIQAPDTTWDESHGNPFSEFLSFYSPITVIPCLLQTNREKTLFYLLNFPFHFCFYLILLMFSNIS